MLLLRWTYFAQPVPDAEVLSLSAYAEDFPDDELDDDVLLGRQPVEDDFIAIAAFDDVVDEDADDADPGIALPEADDFLQVFRVDDEAEDETDDGEAAFNFDWTLFDVTEIISVEIHHDLIDEELSDEFISIDVGVFNVIIVADIIAAFVNDDDADDEIDLDDAFFASNYQFPAAVFFSAHAVADIWPPVSAAAYRFIPLGSGTLTVSAVVGLTAAVDHNNQPLPIPPDAVMALIACEGGKVRWTDDGQTPSTSFGIPLSIGQEFAYSGTFAMIQFAPTITTATLKLSYYK